MVPVVTKNTQLSDSHPFPIAGDDHIIPFTVENCHARGRLVKLGALLDDILSRHDYPGPVAQILAELIGLTTLLGSALKLDGKFIVQTRSDGPINLLVCDFLAKGHVRAYARFDAPAVAAAMAFGQITLPDLLGQGVLAMTIDQGGDRQAYQGIVALDGVSMAEIACNYFAQSEQIPTLIKLSVVPIYQRDMAGKTHKNWRAGGYMAQFLPMSSHVDEREGGEANPLPQGEGWREVEALSATIEDLELTDPDLPAEHLLYRLFHEQGVRVFTPLAVVDRCSCSRDKIHAVLAGFHREELLQTVENGKIAVACEFCSTRHDFDPLSFPAV